MNLRWRADKVKQDIADGISPDTTQYTEAMLAYRESLVSDSTENLDLDYVVEIGEEGLRKEIVEALLLTKATAEDIETVFGVPGKILKWYADLFFDVTQFRSKLDILAYLSEYEDQIGKELKLRAYTLGPDFIYFRYGNLVPETSVQQDLLRKMFMISAYRAMEAQYNTMNSSVSKQSMEWGKMMLKAYEVMDKLFTTDTSDEANTLVDVIVDRRHLTGTEVSVVFEDTDEIG